MSAERGAYVRMTFEEWLRAVDERVQRIAGLGLDDLPDVSLRDWYEDGFTPNAAARKAIRYAKDEGDA
jgi:hypothetical protein